MLSFADIDALIERNPKLAYDELKKIYENNEDMKENVDFLWRFGKTCFMWANSLPKKNPKKKMLIFEGRQYASSAYANDETNFEALRWTAVLTGSATDHLGTREKIEQGKLFKSYLDKAIAINDTEYTLLHLRGRFSFHVANLSWLERKVCSALFEEVPCLSIDDALLDFLEADKWADFTWPENLLYISRCYAIKKDKKLAATYLEKAEMVENPDEATREALTEVRSMIAKLK